LDYLTTHTSLSPIRRGFAPGFVNYKKRCTRLAAASDKVYQLLAHGRWFTPGTPASSTTKTGRHDIAEILLKVALSTKNQIKSNHPLTLRLQSIFLYFLSFYLWQSNYTPIDFRFVTLFLVFSILLLAAVKLYAHLLSVCHPFSGIFYPFSCGSQIICSFTFGLSPFFWYFLSFFLWQSNYTPIDFHFSIRFHSVFTCGSQIIY
jgi:hypothetical protein